MALIDLWRSNREQVEGKHVQQVVGFGGDGRLTDGSAASAEFRVFLTEVSSQILGRYATECLAGSFTASGLVLQDVVNEIGRRLGFDVTHGRYRGVAGQVGFDGLWRRADGYTFVLEVKTTDTYRIDLNTVADYRRRLIRDNQTQEQLSSILIVVGREDTGDLEAQIRGSRHAWDVRLISTEALLRLLTVNEEVDDPATQGRIHEVLKPREFTRLDQIVDLLFSTAEDIRQEREAEPASIGEADGYEEHRVRQFTPAAVNEACVRRLEVALGKTLIKRSRATFASPDDSVRVVCAVSREYTRGGVAGYWFAFHSHHREYLAEVESSFAAFGCGSEERLLCIPYADFSQWLEGMNETIGEDRAYKHVVVSRTGESFQLVLRQGWPRIDLTRYVVRAGP